MDLVGELVLSRNRLSKILSDIEALYEGDEKIKTLIETASNISLITTEIQLSVMKMRMVPIRKVLTSSQGWCVILPERTRDHLEMYGRRLRLTSRYWKQ